MSDGPIKLAPAPAPPLDIILGDDDATLAIPGRSSPPAAKHDSDGDGLAKTTEMETAPEAAAPRARRSSGRVKAADSAEDGTRKRAKMTLRIPDDEVARSQPEAARAALSEQPPGLPPPSERDLQPVRPDPIISVGLSPTSDDTLELPPDELAARGGRVGAAPGHAPGIDGSHEAGWTPYQPSVADREAARDPEAARGDDAPIHPPTSEDAGADVTIQHDSSVPPASEDIPVDTDDEEMTRDVSEDAATNPRLPPTSDSEDIRVEDSDRHTDPGDVSEVDAEDLVSVEAIPLKAGLHSAPPPPKTAAPRGPVVTATSLMSGVTGAAADGATTAAPLAMRAPLAMPAALAGAAPLGPLAVTPIAPAAAARPPSVAPPSNREPNGEAATPADAANPTAGTPMPRRQQPAGGPFGFMPAVGALAPPPMNESAANRKKTRPWWEDLFNDDFIRTMAKITDADISREANFIEESLGCEAGATILDLACGTGRHAVELASRGYQVVGFDLSLAMLARASDEAQDRKQKINFVQGDMREMTFEETFDGVFSWNTSFGYFEDEKNAAVIAKVHRSLKKGGQFLLDVVNRDCIIRQAPSLAWFEGDGCICMDEMQIDFITSRMKVKRTLMMDDGRTKEIEYSIRVYSLHELGKMLHDNGFRVAEVSGGTGTPGVFFGCEAPRTLILAEKR